MLFVAIIKRFDARLRLPEFLCDAIDSNPSQPPPPVILTICGDTVADMPASAACGGAAGYAPDEVLEFIARVVGGNGGE